MFSIVKVKRFKEGSYKPIYVYKVKYIFDSGHYFYGILTYATKESAQKAIDKNTW